jgi:hypothetical protein
VNGRIPFAFQTNPGVGCLKAFKSFSRSITESEEIDMKNGLRWVLTPTALITITLASGAAHAQASKSGMPQSPTTKDGKCAKANGGTWNAKRNGWYTKDRLNYNKCMSGQ